MQLSRWTFLVAVFASFLACHDSPTAPVFDQPYILFGVGDHLLPATISASPGDTLSAIAGAVTLSATGRASIFERIRSVHPGSGVTLTESTTNYTYRIIGDSLAFDYDARCPPDAICVGPPGGKLIGTSLTLTFGNPAYSPPFQYFRVGLD